MKSLLKNRLKDQKGFTLIELLAVIVILGIILAIAIPAVSSLIENSRIDAHISNAQQLESTAKLYFADNPTDSEVKYQELKDAGLMETIDDPHTDTEYSGEDSLVTKTTTKLDDGNQQVTYVTKLASTSETYLSGKSAARYTRDDFRNTGGGGE